MSAKDQGCRFDRDHRNGRYRRNLVVAARSGEGPLTIRFANLSSS
jgi:hypothetical protein